MKSYGKYLILCLILIAFLMPMILIVINAYLHSMILSRISVLWGVFVWIPWGVIAVIKKMKDNHDQ